MSKDHIHAQLEERHGFFILNLGHGLKAYPCRETLSYYVGLPTDERKDRPNVAVNRLDDGWHIWCRGDWDEPHWVKLGVLPGVTRKQALLEAYKAWLDKRAD